MFALISAGVLGQVIGAWLHTRAAQAGGWLVIAVDGKAVRGARNREEKAAHLFAALAHGIGAVLGQVAVDAKSDEIPAVRELLKAFTDLAGAVITVDALHTQSDTAQAITGRHAGYVMTVEHGAHCSCLSAGCVKQSRLAVFYLDTQAFPAALGDLDGVELAALDLVQHGLAGDPEDLGGCGEGDPAGWGLGCDAVAELLVDADAPRRAGGELFADEEAFAQPPVEGRGGHAEFVSGPGDGDHERIVSAWV